MFEDIKAVIKMIIKERSPTMRHVSRTHRVAFDMLFDRINLDPKIQIKILTPKTDSQTWFPREVSHVTSGIMFCVCSILAISVLQFVLNRWHSKVKTTDATKRRHLTIIMNNLLKAPSQHATQGGMMTKLGLLESGKLINRWMIERGNPL